MIIEYKIATEEDLLNLGYSKYRARELYGKVLINSKNFQCILGEPEDCTWYKDGSIVVDELNKLLDRIDNINNCA